jgi:hypothetical protein
MRDEIGIVINIVEKRRKSSIDSIEKIWKKVKNEKKIF